MAFDPFEKAEDKWIYLFIVLAIIILPNGASDIIIIPAIVKVIGIKGYLILATSIAFIIFSSNKIKAKFKQMLGM